MDRQKFCENDDALCYVDVRTPEILAPNILAFAFPWQWSTISITQGCRDDPGQLNAFGALFTGYNVRLGCSLEQAFHHLPSAHLGFLCPSLSAYTYGAIRYVLPDNPTSLTSTSSGAIHGPGEMII